MGKTVQIFGFPENVSAKEVKIFLENHTGKGTVHALKVKQPQAVGPNRKASAIVQFTTEESVDLISSLINGRLSYGRSKLNFRDAERDIVPKPRASMLSLEIAAMYFRNQLSTERFSVLWKGMNVVVNFETGLRKMEFLLSHCSKEYKLEFSYDSIWEIQLRCPPKKKKKNKFLVIQVSAAPRIYEKDLASSGQTSNDLALTYFKDAIDDQWVRTTDFTISRCCIGQSFAICLELPLYYKLQGIRENFYYYKEDVGQFHVEIGSTFSLSLDLVPIVGPPQGIDLPYSTVFKINSLVQSGCLAGPTLDSSFYNLVHPQNVPSAYIEHALEKLRYLRECCYEPAKWLDEQYKTYSKLKHFNKPSVSLNDGLVFVRRVQITPLKVYFYGPEVIVSNRVLRHYHKLIDNFIRVSFVDEDGKKMRSTDLSPRTLPNAIKRHTDIYRRILSTLSNGIVIGEKNFEFLAFSSSQLRESCVWMFASENGVTAASIRKWMGDFREIKNVAKYAARLGQSFSSSKKTLSVRKREMEIIPDVQIERNGVNYVFSDGIGKISPKFAQKVAEKCGIEGSSPSCFQIRYGGYKGVVAVDPTSATKLSLRESMLKYKSDNTDLDVLSWSKFQPCFLNRQLITLLSTLGVRDQIFEKKQREILSKLNVILTDSQRALEALEMMSPGENRNVLTEMLCCGYKPDAEPFLSMMLQTFRQSKLLDLLKKSRIYIPNGRSLMGCLDETRTLEYGEVFIQISCAGRKQDGASGSIDQCNRIVEGTVVVAKNPCLHPGDVRLLLAVNVPGLHHMVDCVVFPQKGIRPHPNECSGSDLDGDIYFVTWDHELIPPREVEAMDYTPAPPAIVGHDVKLEEVYEYFANYMVNDSLGIIANAHTAFADKDPDMAESDACKELAKLFSIAVDFPKTGVPAEIPPHLRVKEYPDFMEKPDKPTCESQRVIGKLFRAVKDVGSYISCIPSFTWEVAKSCYDYDIEVEGFDYYLDDAQQYKEKYDFKLGNIMDTYGIKNEADVLAKGLVKESISFNGKKDAAAVGAAVRFLREEARKWFDENESDSDDLYAKASAWYHVTYHPNYWGAYNEGMKRDHYLSFPWCVYDKLIHIKRQKAENVPGYQSLEQQFSRGVWLG